MKENSFKLPYYHIGTEEITVKTKVGETASLPTTIKAYYNDGGEADIKVKWDTECDLPGGKNVSGRLSTDAYPDPFIAERADPYVLKQGDKYYFTASYPAFGSVEKGYDRIILRESSTLLGLADTREKTVWRAHKKGIMARHIWAPEIHFIGGKWYIFFAAGENPDIWNIRPYVLVCDGDPMRDEWKELGKMQASTGDDVSFNSFSLDMTYFEHKSRPILSGLKSSAIRLCLWLRLTRVSPTGSSASPYSSLSPNTIGKRSTSASTKARAYLNTAAGFSSSSPLQAQARSTVWVLCTLTKTAT